MIHSARPPAISRSSFASRGRSGAVRRSSSRERKEYFLQACVAAAGSCSELIERPAAAHAPVREQNKTAADPFGIGQLMDREHERAALVGLGAEQAHDVAGLAQIEAVERLAHPHSRMA